MNFDSFDNLILESFLSFEDSEECDRKIVF